MSYIKGVKGKIPKALREQVWLRYMGRQFEGKCLVKWCTNRITVFDWEAGHNIPESKGGKTSIENLRCICSRCNKSMGDSYTIDEWNELTSGSVKTERKPRKKIAEKSCCGFCVMM